MNRPPAEHVRLTPAALEDARARDRADPLRAFREQFLLPDGLVYLDGNSLGPPPVATRSRLSALIDHEWGGGLVRSWNTHDWISSPTTIGAKIAGLVGAQSDQIIVTDSTSVNIFRLVLSALELQRGRQVVLSETGNFPTDLYCCEGAIRAIGAGHRLRLEHRSELIEAIDADTALVVLTHVNYKSAQIFDMAEITRIAHERGALVLWDLCHSTGAVTVDLDGIQADFAVGCGYKYLNGGPGAPAFLYVARRHHASATNSISGWLGHDRPFEFADSYTPANGIRRFLSGTPSILANSALEVGVDLVLEAGLPALMQKSKQLSTLFIDLVDSLGGGSGLTLLSPRDANDRGSHISYSHPYGYELMQALIDANVIGDFRAPDVVRFGFTPLYTRYEDIWIAVNRLNKVLSEAHWKNPRYAIRARVT